MDDELVRLIRELMVLISKRSDEDINRIDEEYDEIKWELGAWFNDTFHRVILAPIHTSRGCPHKCTFCINPITKNRWRAKSAKIVLDELELVVEKFRGIKVRMWDENFFVNKKRAIEIIDGINERGIDCEWETTVRSDYFRPNFLGEEFLAKLKKSGCYKLCFGAESGSQKILEMLCKGVSVEQIIESASQCKKFGIIPEYSFMIGLPEESLDDMKKTIQLINKLLKVNDDTEFIGPQPFRPYPGSPLYNKCVADYGWKSPNTLREWSALMEKEWGYLSSKNFSWVENPDFVDALWPYLHYALTDFTTALGSGVEVNKILKIMFILSAKIRFRFKYFNHPIEYKIAKRFI